MWEGPAEAISPSACPLCHDWDGSVTTVPTVYAKGQSAFPGPVTTRQFRRHLGRHLEELALFALPKYDVAEGDNDHDDEASQSSLDEEEDLDTEALTQLLMELNMAPEGNPDRPAHLHQSSTLLLKRYMKNGNMDDLEHAAALAAQAVAALGRKHPSYTMFLETLDQALKAHPQRKSNFMGITLMSNSGDDLLFSTHTLHEGARLGLASVVRYLVAKGVNDALEDTSRTNALHVAANIGQLEVVQVLLDAGADIRACNDIGWTALHLACAKGDEAVARTLLDKGAALEAATRDTGRTALYLAVASKSIKLVTLLLDRGADVSVRDRSGSTVLSYPASTGQLEMVKLLLDRNAVPSLSNQLGITPLHRAAGMGHVAVVRLLLERADVDVDARDVHNMSALHVAAEKGHEAVVRLLLERGDGTADPRNITGKTPLHFAIENGYEEVVRLLLSSDIVDVGASDANGQTALHIAAEKAHEAIVRLLLDFGASSTARNNAGQTPLDRAVLAGRTQVANVLRPGATSSYVWFCGHCGDGPQSPEIDVACPNCGRPRDQFAKIVSYG
jgi:ankyrin repeat protein